MQDSEQETTSSQDASKAHVRTARDISDIAGASSRLTGHTHSDTTHTHTTTTAEADVEHSQQNVTGQTTACAKSGPINTDELHVNGASGADAKPGPSKAHQTRANGQIRDIAKPGPSKAHQTRANGQIRDDAKPGPSKAHQTRANGQIRDDAKPGPNKTDRICVREEIDVKLWLGKTNRTRGNGQIRAVTQSPVPNALNSELDDLDDDKCTSSRVGEVEKPVTRQRGKAKRKYVSYDSDSLENEDSEAECVTPKLAKKKTPASKVDLGTKWQNTRVGKNKTKGDRKKQQAEWMLVDRWRSKFPH